MRRIALCATTALALTCTTATAFGQSTVEIDSHATPVVRKFSPTTTPTNLSVNLKFHGPNGKSADTLTGVILKFTYGAKLNGNLFPSCTAQTINDKKPCPKGTQIGSGTALGIVGGDSDNPTKEPIKVTLYNGPGGKSIVFRIQGDAPVVIDIAFDAPLKTFTTGNYNFQLTVKVPDSLQVIAGLPVSLDYFNVNVGANRKVKGRKRGYIETLICPPLALVPIQGDFTFLDADPFHIDTYIHCGK